MARKPTDWLTVCSPDRPTNRLAQLTNKLTSQPERSTNWSLKKLWSVMFLLMITKRNRWVRAQNMTIIQLITTYPVNRKCSVHCPSLGGSWTCTLQVRVVMLKKIARQLWEVTRTVDCLNNTWTTSNLSAPPRSASNFSTIYEKKVWHADQEDVELNSPK